MKNSEIHLEVQLKVLISSNKMSKTAAFQEASRKLLLLLRKAFLIRKHVYIFTMLQFLIAIVFTLQIRLIFEPAAFRLQHNERARISQILRMMPKDVECRYLPNNQFVSRLMESAAKLLQIKITPAAINDSNAKNPQAKTLWAIFSTTNEASNKPTVMEYRIRSYDHSHSFSPIWHNEEPSRDDPYMKTGFIPLQVAIDISFMNMWKRKQLWNSQNKISLGRFPYHTLNLLVMPVPLEPSVLIAYCLMIIAYVLIPVEVLHKVIHDKRKGFRELMHVMGMSQTMLYTGWILYMLLVAIPVTIICTIMLNPILVNANALTISTFVLLYLIVSTCFMFFVGTFFNDSLKACLVSTMLWLLLSYLSIILDGYTKKTSHLSQIAMLCLPHNGLLYGLSNLAARQQISDLLTSPQNIANLRLDLESNFVNSTLAMKSKKVTNFLNNNQKVSLILILLSWVLHIIFWMLLTIYFDKVKPGKHGAAKPWYYPCQKCVSKPLHVDMNYSSTTKWSTVEPTPPSLIPVITIRQITKYFGSTKNRVIAIDAMSIDFYEGEFHIILGHNGAGKSTLLKMIVGMYKPSRGDIYVLGRDYNRQKNSDCEKNLIGYCPQDNVLVNDLTAIEHVYIFGMLKGMPYKEAFEKAESMLMQLGLGADQHKKVKHFSFGMKRRVCLSMALIGNAKILVLDEPGYGVDPQNRRKIWDMLLELKEQRTIVMTTNSMEAADILPDRIAIIANGRVKCYGSKMYLNRRFGVAYLLSIVIEEDCDLEYLTFAIQSFSSDQIKLQIRLGAVIKYDLPRRTAFAKLLQHLEYNMNTLKIKSIGLNVTSIAEQFRRIGFMSHVRSRGITNTFYNDHEFEMMIRKRRHDLLIEAKTWTRRKGHVLSIQQIGILFYKKFLHVSRLWNVYVCSLLFSLVAFIFFLEVAHRFKLHIATTRVNEVNISRYAAIGLRILLHCDAESKTLLNALIDTIKLFDSDETANHYDVSNDITATELISKPTWDSMKIRERYFMGIDVSAKNNINLLYSVTASHSGPISINFLHNALLRYYGCDNCLIKLETEPILDPEQWQSRIIHTSGVRNWQNFSILVTLFLLLPSIILITNELRSSSKQLQLNTIGISVMKYWAPIYIIDILIYFLCLLLIAILIAIFYDVASDISGIEFLQMLTIFLLYGIAALPMGYILHFFVRRVEITSIIVLMLNVITLVFINGSFAHPTLTEVVSTPGIHITYILFHMFPQYTLACAISSFYSIHIYNSQCRYLDGCRSPFWREDPCCHACGDGGCYRPLSIMWTKRMTLIFHHSIMVDIAVFLIQTFVFITIIMLIESRYKAKIGRYYEKQIYPAEFNESITETNVLFEKEEVDNFMKDNTASSNVILSVQNLSKKFGGKPVLRGISFNVYRNECLGLLGINGSGKSTIFKILSREELPTSGRAIIENYDLIKDDCLFSSMVGYCPQVGGLNKFMTARQNLRLHATLRGIPLDRVRDEVDKWLDAFDLLDYENIQVKYCPWGIQRKICILQSLIGDLPVVLLDEPTAGLDAIARQVVCDTLHFVRQMGRSLLVTTQSLEEAESLCLRIGVLVKGQFVAFGSSEQLKHRHGGYFTLNLRLPGTASLQKIEKVKRSVENMFIGFDFKGLHAGILKYEIQASATMYSIIFDTLEKLKAKHPEIFDSSVSQTTMENVFLSLCEKYQDIKIPQEKPICLQKCINNIHRI